MSLVIDLIGQLNCMLLANCSGRSFVYQIVSSVCCSSVFMPLISRLYGAVNCWHRFSGVCSKLVNQLSRVSRW